MTTKAGRQLLSRLAPKCECGNQAGSEGDGLCGRCRNRRDLANDRQHTFDALRDSAERAADIDALREVVLEMIYHMGQGT